MVQSYCIRMGTLGSYATCILDCVQGPIVLRASLLVLLKLMEIPDVNLKTDKIIG